MLNYKNNKGRVFIFWFLKFINFVFLFLLFVDDKFLLLFRKIVNKLIKGFICNKWNEDWYLRVDIVCRCNMMDYLFCVLDVGIMFCVIVGLVDDLWLVEEVWILFCVLILIVMGKINSLFFLRFFCIINIIMDKNNFNIVLGVYFNWVW